MTPLVKVVAAWSYAGRYEAVAGSEPAKPRQPGVASRPAAFSQGVMR